MSDQLDTLLSEKRRFPTTAEFAARATPRTAALYAAGRTGSDSGKTRPARSSGCRRGTEVLDWKPPHAKWFVGGKLNASANCLTATSHGPRRNKAAIIWEGEPGDRRVLTYWDLARRSAAAPTRSSGSASRKGDRVAIYLPMVPEAAIAMLACARIGAVHSVVFGGFSAEALRDRINDAGAVVLITADGGYRRGQILAAQAHGRRRHGRDALDPALHRGPPATRRRGRRGVRHDDGGSRPLVAPAARARVARLPAGADGRRGYAVHPLHLRHHREAQGDRSHDRRLSHPRDLHRQARVRPEATKTCSGAPPTSAGSPGIPTSSTARWRTGPPCSCTRAPPTGPSATASGSIIERLRRHHPLHGADRDPGLHEVGGRASRPARPVHPAAARHRWESRSIRKRGCGITSTSAGSAAPSWTPGGRPRPAAS